MKIILMLLILVFTIPLSATTSQDETGENSLRISIINIQEVGLNQAVTAPIFYHEGIMPRKQKLFSLLEYKSDKTNTSIQIAKSFSINTNKSGGRRIKSGRH